MGFEPVVKALRGWFARRLSSEADIDDAVQDVWLRTHEHLESGTVENERAYVFTAARSVLTDRARRASVRHEQAHESLEEIHHPVEWITPERVILGEEAIAMVMHRLENMPEKTRDIFILHRFENMTYREIANAMGLSISAVEKHIMKALLDLMEDLR
ncbi:sigma-70 family RNA polymerase sigma factor [Novosphingobium sp. 1949]|uniref:Sigma-70 family RNA polymerase sigma factor n=1 Tax=Novosphingobium organovorum TaxID=2930092 RepID=A0ABT0BK59_9SPHN|nr:sigma-70 family RNA polymerase sigma factor [Novosphingobium organovorum]MCJ2185114.1 sigma-70 family RNA polymerase sigma factor [Novosphingobium organovorum]